MDKIDEQLYQVAGEELLTKNVNLGLWTRAFSLALGDEQKTKAIYIELRVESLRQQYVEEIKREKVASKKRALSETERIKMCIEALSSISWKDTDQIPSEKFSGDPKTLSHPVSASRAATITGVFEFEIIDLIKRGYLKGVRCRDEWFFDLDYCSEDRAGK